MKKLLMTIAVVMLLAVPAMAAQDSYEVQVMVRIDPYVYVTGIGGEVWFIDGQTGQETEMATSGTFWVHSNVDVDVSATVADVPCMTEDNAAVEDIVISFVNINDACPEHGATMTVTTEGDPIQFGPSRGAQVNVRVKAVLESSAISPRDDAVEGTITVTVSSVV